jgi:5-(carboxyamino)imidazole ribonucleotide synthase
VEWVPQLMKETVGWAGLCRRDWQKSLLDSLGLATAPWHRLASSDDLDRARSAWGGVVIKRSRGGYDGRGQWQLRDGQPAGLPDDVYGHAIAEAMIDFSAEVSLVGARTREGQCLFYPLTQNWHDQGILRVSHAPARAAVDWQQQAEAMLSTLMHGVDYVGVMGMECFVTDAGLLINEIAPRVHNSGHWTQAGTDLDQFALHVRCHCGVPVHAPRVRGESLMVNLIGHPLNKDLLTADGVDLHWYGKAVRPGRKLGHVNVQALNRSALLEKAGALTPLLDVEARAVLTDVLQALT